MSASRQGHVGPLLSLLYKEGSRRLSNLPEAPRLVSRWLGSQGSHALSSPIMNGIFLGPLWGRGGEHLNEETEVLSFTFFFEPKLQLRLRPLPTTAQVLSQTNLGLGSPSSHVMTLVLQPGRCRGSGRGWHSPSLSPLGMHPHRAKTSSSPFPSCLYFASKTSTYLSGKGALQAGRGPAGVFPFSSSGINPTTRGQQSGSELSGAQRPRARNQGMLGARVVLDFPTAAS